MQREQEGARGKDARSDGAAGGRRAGAPQDEIQEGKRAWEERFGLRSTEPDPISDLDLVEVPEEDVIRTYLERLGFPGQPPFTRGVYPTMYRGRLWTMRQYAGYATPEAANARFRKLLDQGQTGLSVAFDLPTQMGLDSDHPMAEGEVGRVGVAVDGIWDFEALMRGIPMDRVSTSMTINATASILLGMYVGAARRCGISPAGLSGTVQNDILKEYVSRGTYIFPGSASLRLTIDLMAYCLSEVPHWNPISVSGYHMREAGATAAQELGFTFAHALAYAEAARVAGLDIEQILPRFSFFFAVHNRFLEEVAKFRAGRRLWSRIVKERLGVGAETCRRLRFHAQTAGSTLTAQQPLNNTVRSTLQALAAVLGGAQSLHVNAFDEALSLPSEEGAELALRTQQIIAYESGVTATADPLGGGFAVEKLTGRIEEEAWECLKAVDEAGGAVQAAESGFTASRIGEAAYAAQRRIESGEDVLVGLNRYQDDSRSAVASTFETDPRAEATQRERLAHFRQSRDRDGVLGALDRVGERARHGGSLTEAIVEAVHLGATVGEVSGRLRDVFGGFQEPGGLVP